MPPPPIPPSPIPPHGAELDDALTQLDDGSGWFTVCGFGSLLSERSARATLPDLRNFRKTRIKPGGFAYRRVFAHTADVFFERGIADPATREVASLSLERVVPTDRGGDDGGGGCDDGGGIVVTAFEAPYTPASVAAFVAREHEFKLVAVHLDDGGGGGGGGSVAVACERWSDGEYIRRRFGGDRAAFERRWGVVWRDGHGNGTVWHDESVLPCRLYFRHCVLAARRLGEEEGFLRTTFLADRKTTAGEWLERLEEACGGEFLATGRSRNSGDERAMDAALLARYGG
jgi:hypothetical protein